MFYSLAMLRSWLLALILVSTASAQSAPLPPDWEQPGYWIAKCDKDTLYLPKWIGEEKDFSEIGRFGRDLNLQGSFLPSSLAGFENATITDFALGNRGELAIALANPGPGAGDDVENHIVFIDRQNKLLSSFQIRDFLRIARIAVLSDDSVAVLGLDDFRQAGDPYLFVFDRSGRRKSRLRLIRDSSEKLQKDWTSQYGYSRAGSSLLIAANDDILVLEKNPEVPLIRVSKQGAPLKIQRLPYPQSQGPAVFEWAGENLLVEALQVQGSRDEAGNISLQTIARHFYTFDLRTGIRLSSAKAPASLVKAITMCVQGEEVLGVRNLTPKKHELWRYPLPKSSDAGGGGN